MKREFVQPSSRLVDASLEVGVPERSDWNAPRRLPRGSTSSRVSPRGCRRRWRWKGGWGVKVGGFPLSWMRGLGFLLVVMGVLGICGASPAHESVPESGSPSSDAEDDASTENHRVDEPTVPPAWFLPTSAAVGCADGDVDGIHWSPDGEQLAVEVNGKSRGQSICRIEFGAVELRGSKGGVLDVKASLVSASAMTGKRSAAAAALGAGKESNYEPAWGPIGDDASLPLAFVSVRPRWGGRAMYVPDTRGGEARALTLDGGDPRRRPRHEYHSPAWAPLGDTSASRLVVVSTTRGQRCIGAHLAILALDADGKALPNAYKAITDPCGGESKARRADSQPSWDPGAKRDRIVFVRDDGSSFRLCMIEGVRRAYEGDGDAASPDFPAPRCGLGRSATAEGSPLRPVITKDGRYLVYYVVRGLVPSREHAAAPIDARSTYSIEVIDLEAGTLAAHEIARGIVPNPWQPPPLLFVPRTGRWWTLAIVRDENGNTNKVIRYALDGKVQKELHTGLSNIKVLSTGRLHGTKAVLAASAMAHRSHVDRGRSNHDVIFMEPIDLSEWIE